MQPPGPRPLSQRIGDRERDEAVTCLQQHYTAGRLDDEERDERLASALRARTEADLAVLFTDLPLPHPPSHRLAAPPPPSFQSAPAPRVSDGHKITACVFAVVTAGYLLPWAVAALRDRSDTAKIGLLSLLLGWSGVGWVVLLVLAALPERPTLPAPHASPQPHDIAQPLPPSWRAGEDRRQ